MRRLIALTALAAALAMPIAGQAQTTEVAGVKFANTVQLASWFKTSNQFRSFDLADRRQDIVKGRLNYAVTENLDTAPTLQPKDASYPSAGGRE